MNPNIIDCLDAIEYETGIPSCYSHFPEPIEPPYIVYIGAGQNQFRADDTTTWRRNEYQVEYYFPTKNEAVERSIEDIFLAFGFVYEKSDDVYEESQGLFVIFYDLN